MRVRIGVVIFCVLSTSCVRRTTHGTNACLPDRARDLRPTIQQLEQLEGRFRITIVGAGRRLLPFDSLEFVKPAHPNARIPGGSSPPKLSATESDAVVVLVSSSDMNSTVLIRPLLLYSNGLLQYGSTGEIHSASTVFTLTHISGSSFRGRWQHETTSGIEIIDVVTGKPITRAEGHYCAVRVPADSPIDY